MISKLFSKVISIFASPTALGQLCSAIGGSSDWTWPARLCYESASDCTWQLGSVISVASEVLRIGVWERLASNIFDRGVSECARPAYFVKGVLPIGGGRFRSILK